MTNTVGKDRLILRYIFEPIDKPGQQWTNVFKIVKRDDFLNVWITNGADKYAQYRLSREQARELIMFLVENAK
jgi:hypothetical protein